MGSGLGLPEEVADAAEEPNVENRLEVLEDTLSRLKGVVEQLPSQLAALKAEKTAPRKVLKSAKPTASELDAMDLGVVASARQAGGPEAQLVKIAKLMNKKPNMGEPPHTRAKRSNVLSGGSEGEEEEEEEVEEDEGGVCRYVRPKVVVGDLRFSMSPSRTCKLCLAEVWPEKAALPKQR